MQKDNLHALIRSMSKAEKRYFKLYAGRFSKSKIKNHIQLFDFLNSKGDEKFEYSTFQKKYKTKNISSVKSYLFNAVLDSIIEFKSNKDLNIELFVELNRINVLLDRKLLESVYKKIEKTIPKAIEANNPIILHELHKKKNVLSSFDDQNHIRSEASINALETQLELATVLKTCSTLDYIQSILVHLVNNPSIDPKNLLKLVEPKLFSEEVEQILDGPLLLYKLIYHSSIGHFYWVKNDMINLFRSQSRAFTWIKTEIESNEVVGMSILSFVYNFFATCLRLKEYKLLYEEYNWYKQTVSNESINNTHRERSFHFRIINEYYFKLANHTSYISFDKTILKEFEKRIKELDIELKDVEGAMLISDVIHYCFKHRFYKKCVQYIYKFQQLPSFLNYERIALSLEIVRLLCYLESEEYNILKRELKHLNKFENYPEFKEAFQTFFNAMIKLPSQKRKLKKVLIDQLEVLHQKPEYEYCFEVIDFFEW